MTSPLPPKRRDTVGTPNLLRQDRIRLGQLDRGLVDGRYPPARPLRPPGLGDGDEDDVADGVLYAWEWNDRHTVTSTGTQHPILSHAPVDEALAAHWHPAGRGGLPVTSEFLSVDGHNVTIIDPAGLLAVGDQFSFQYPYDPDGEDDTPDAFDGLIPHGVTAYYGVAPRPTSLALPAGTSIGDLLVFGAIGSSGILMTDSRMTEMQPSVWVGRADTLSALQVTSAGTYWGAIVGAFDSNTLPTTSAQNTGGVTSIALPTPAGSGGIAVVMSAYSVVDGQADPPGSPWVDAGGTGTGKAHARIAYWADLTQTVTPAASSNLGSAASSSATVLGFG